MTKIPVLYVGLQEGCDVIPDFHLVDEPSGSTKKYDPERHKIVGVSESAAARGTTIPKELQ